MASQREKLVIDVARAYVKDRKATYASLAQKFNVSSTTIGKLLNTELKSVNPKLWAKVNAKKEKNVKNSQRYIAQMNKKTFLQKVLAFFKK